MKALITGSAGLIGTQAALFFAKKGYQVYGIDNDMRSYFFGAEGSNTKNLRTLVQKLEKKYQHFDLDIRDYPKTEEVFKKNRFDIIVHTAAQPSHDWAAREPLTDFSINATGTLNLLELTRLYSPDATFIFTSTNKVYGDTPNNLPLNEEETRFEIQNDHPYFKGIDEQMSIDQTKHSLFGASKAAADLLVQEYGRYFGMKTGIFRGGCLTGPNHSGVELHGFLAYLVKCVLTNKPYKIFGYKGKQVRDNIHADDLIGMFWCFHQTPREGEVYNVGGGRPNSVSVLEAIAKTNKLAQTSYQSYSIVDENRIGDHIWYISDLSKFKSHYPDWQLKFSVENVISQIISSHET